MIAFHRYRTGIQGTCLALSRVEGAPHKPFGLELRAEKVHAHAGRTTKQIQATRKLAPDLPRCATRPRL
jgi:hypothetical protein